MSEIVEAVKDAPRYLTLKEAVVEGYGAYSTLRKWIYEEKLLFRKTGHRVQLLREDLEALVLPYSEADALDAHIEALVDAAPSLNEDQVSRLRFALGGDDR